MSPYIVIFMTESASMNFNPMLWQLVTVPDMTPVLLHLHHHLHIYLLIQLDDSSSNLYRDSDTHLVYLHIYTKEASFTELCMCLCVQEGKISLLSCISYLYLVINRFLRLHLF